MLLLEAVEARFGDFAVKADLSLAKGARLAVMGASGSGKSSLLSLIGGFWMPDRGKIRINGADVTQLRPAQRPLSVLFQDGNLFPHLSVFDNVALGIRPNLSRISADERGQINDSLEKVGLPGFGARHPADLSGGQQSRVALARMLVRDKPLALFDEPFAALDPPLRRDMIGLIDQLCAETGLTVVMVTHDIRDAERLCDRLLLMGDGHIRLEGATQDLLAACPDALQPWL